MAVESYANLAEATFSKHSSNLVPFFNILDIFKSFKIFEVQNVAELVFVIHFLYFQRLPHFYKINIYKFTLKVFGYFLYFLT